MRAGVILPSAPSEDEQATSEWLEPIPAGEKNDTPISSDFVVLVPDPSIRCRDVVVHESQCRIPRRRLLGLSPVRANLSRLAPWRHFSPAMLVIARSHLCASVVPPCVSRKSYKRGRCLVSQGR
jgi:hypothetical protein